MKSNRIPPERRAQAFQVMVKPTGPKCNLDCTYCYYLDKSALYPDEGKFRMRADLLETFIADYIANQAAAGQRDIWFAWQGGEPTMLGLDYFRTIVALQQRHCPPGHRVHNALQTNGTLLDEEWAIFLNQRGFLVGLSIDGPPHLHDHYRRDRRNLPSSDRVLAAWELLMRHRVETNVLCTVNDNNARHPLEVYRYLRGMGAQFLQFIPVVERVGTGGGLAAPPQSGEDSIAVTPWSVRPGDYGQFLCAIFDEWVRYDVGKVFVQLFDLQVGVWLGQPASLCVFAETCGSCLALEHNGDLYACDHYVHSDYRLGNITRRPIAELAALARQRRFGHDKKARLPDVCKQCQWRFACHGGCPKDRFLPAPGKDHNRLNYLCQATRMFFSHAAPYLNTIAGLIRNGLPAARIMTILERQDGPVPG